MAKKGLGLALLHHAFGVFYDQGKNSVGLGVDGDSLTRATKLYEKVGMKVQQQIVTYELELRPKVELEKQSLQNLALDAHNTPQLVYFQSPG